MLTHTIASICEKGQDSRRIGTVISGNESANFKRSSRTQARGRLGENGETQRGLIKAGRSDGEEWGASVRRVETLRTTGEQSCM